MREIPFSLVQFPLYEFMKVSLYQPSLVNTWHMLREHSFRWRKSNLFFLFIKKNSCLIFLPQLLASTSCSNFFGFSSYLFLQKCVNKIEDFLLLTNNDIPWDLLHYFKLSLILSVFIPILTSTLFFIIFPQYSNGRFFEDMNIQINIRTRHKNPTHRRSSLGIRQGKKPDLLKLPSVGVYQAL